MNRYPTYNDVIHGHGGFLSLCRRSDQTTGPPVATEVPIGTVSPLAEIYASYDPYRDKIRLTSNRRFRDDVDRIYHDAAFDRFNNIRRNTQTDRTRHRHARDWIHRSRNGGEEMPDPIRRYIWDTIENNSINSFNNEV
jgi:hypothetical protein